MQPLGDDVDTASAISRKIVDCPCGVINTQKSTGRLLIGATDQL
jgi:hypothetical protein